MTLENIFKNKVAKEEVSENFIRNNSRIKNHGWSANTLSKYWILNQFRSDLNTINRYLHQLSFDFNHEDREFAKNSKYGEQAMKVDLILKDLRTQMDYLSNLSAEIKL